MADGRPYGGLRERNKPWVSLPYFCFKQDAMCYYLSQRPSNQSVLRAMNLNIEAALFPSITAPVLVGFQYPSLVSLVFDEQTNAPKPRAMEWGYLPSYWKNRDQVSAFRQGFRDPKSGKWVQYLTLNARADRLLAAGKMFRQAALTRRCLVPATSFFEWRHLPRRHARTGAPLKSTEKYPYFIGPRKQNPEKEEEEALLYLAAIYQPWTDVDTGEHIETVAIVTTDANGLMQKIHNTKKRMPTLLPVSLAHTWMDPGLEEKEIDQLARFQWDDHRLTAHPIEKNFLQSNSPQTPHHYAELPDLSAEV